MFVYVYRYIYVYIKKKIYDRYMYREWLVIVGVVNFKYFWNFFYFNCINVDD